MSVIDAAYEVEWYRVPVEREQLRELNRRSDCWGLAQAGGFLALVVATGGLCIWLAVIGQWWWLLPALFLHGTVSAFHINAVHELVHGTVFRSGWLNQLFVHLFAFLGWHNHYGFWASHSEHHRYTLHDPHDQEEVVPKQVGLADVLATVVNPFLLLREIRSRLRSACGRLNGDWQRALLDGRERRHAVFRWSRVLLLGHLTIAVVSLAYGLWIVPVVVSCTPAYGRTLQFLLNSTQHIGMRDHVSDFRQNCRTMIVNPVFRFLYWHMNWHIEHHMYAGVPCYRLKRLHELIRHELPEPSRGLLGTWFEIIYAQYRQRREPGWCLQPEIPGEGSDVRPAPATSLAEAPAAPAAAGPARRVWQCSVCGFIYDEARGLPEEGIAPGTAWADIPEDWSCPDCGVAKSDFIMTEISRPVVAADSPAAGPLVIVGSGLAGYAVVRELRSLGDRRRVVMLTADDGAQYGKPQLSVALAGGRGPDELVQRHATAAAAELGIELRSGVRVEAIDREHRRLVCQPVDDATAVEAIAYDRLVLATGAEPVRPPLAGTAADAVLQVNDLGDYRRFRAALPAGGRVLIIGGGLIGCEFANDLVATGHAVTVVDLGATPLGGLAPAVVGGRLQAALAAAGVAWQLQDGVERVDHGEDGALQVRLASGASWTGDLVLAAIGLRPRTALAEAAGLAVDRGIVVDEHLQTSDPAIAALGDGAVIDGVWRPYATPIAHAARSLAAGLAGQPRPVAFPPMPVVVKTPALPVAVLPPPAGCAGGWSVDADCAEVVWFTDAEGERRGLALIGPAVADRQRWLAELPGPGLAATV